MALILAVDPELRQRAALERLARELAGHQLVSAPSFAEALTTIERTLPDLILLSLLIAEGDESTLLTRARELAGGTDVPALTIPLLESSDPALLFAAQSRRFGRPDHLESDEECEPRVFTDRVRQHLGAARSEPRRERVAAAPLAPTSAQPPSRARVLAAATAAASWVRARHTAWDAPLDARNILAEAPTEFSSQYVEPAIVIEAPHAAPPIAQAIAPRVTQAATAQLPQAETWATVPFEATAPVKRAPVRPAPEIPAPSGTTRAAAQARSAGGSVRRWAPRIAAAAVLVVIGAAGRAYWLRPAIPKTGTAVLRSVPDGSQVVVDGAEIGKTPITTTLSAGVHTVEFRLRNAKRTVLVNVSAGGQVIEGVDWTKKPTGRLQVSSEPPGARVLIDGIVRGMTPVTLTDITVGTHAVMLESKDGSVRRSVTIKADETAEVSDSVFPGFLAIFSPFELTITEGKRAIRLDDRNQVMLPPGPHDLRLENRALGYQEVRRVEVQPGALTSFSIVPPRSRLAVTASAVAEVWVDGVAVGQTPLVDVPVDLGTREVLLRSAAGVERRLTVTITVKPVAVNVEF